MQHLTAEFKYDLDICFAVTFISLYTHTLDSAFYNQCETSFGNKHVMQRAVNDSLAKVSILEIVIKNASVQNGVFLFNHYKFK